MEPPIQRKAKVRKKKPRIATLQLRPDQEKRREAFIRALDTMLMKADRPLGIVYEAENGLSYGVVWGCRDVSEILRMEALLHDAICPDNTKGPLNITNNKVN